MKSGMLAAESAFAAIQAERSSDVLDDYEANLRSSWIATELQLVKNAEPLLSKFGNSIGTVLAGIDMWMRTLKIGLPFTMKHKPDAAKLWRKDVSRKIDYPKPDGVLRRSEERRVGNE